MEKDDLVHATAVPTDPQCDQLHTALVRIADLEKALKRFANLATVEDQKWPNAPDTKAMVVPLGYLRHARSVLTSPERSGDRPESPSDGR